MMSLVDWLDISRQRVHLLLLTPSLADVCLICAATSPLLLRLHRFAKWLKRLFLGTTSICRIVSSRRRDAVASSSRLDGLSDLAIHRLDWAIEHSEALKARRNKLLIGQTDCD